MRAVCLDGPEHYLGQDQTLNMMQTEYVYPNLGSRTSPKEWMELGKPDLIDAVRRRKEEMLAQPSLARFDPQTDHILRDNFNILLPE